MLINEDLRAQLLKKENSTSGFLELMSFIMLLTFSSLFEKQRLIYIYWSFLGGSVVKESTSQLQDTQEMWV